MKVDAKWLILILAIFGGLLCAQYWAGSQWRSQQGPDLLVTDHQGNLYIGIHSKILRYSPSGKFIDQRDLMEIGIEARIGGIGFFPNGDLLMVPQNYNPSFIQRLLMTYRITTPIPQHLQGVSGRLSRCVWATMQCTPLSKNNRQFSEAFWVEIDEYENIFLADTSQHQIFWLDKDGAEVDRFGNSPAVQFPNQIKREGDFLWVANCNDNSLSRIKLQGSLFSSAIERFPLADSRLPSRHRWPIGVVIADDDYLVLAKGDNLMYGSIVKMDGAGEIKQVFSDAGLNQKTAADFISLVWFNNELLAADFASLSIKRLSQYGEFRGEFDAPEFIGAVIHHRKDIDRYKKWERYFSWVFWSLLVSGFCLALYLEKRHRAAQVDDKSIQEVNPHFAPQVGDKRIQWLVYRFFWRNINKWLIWFWAPLILLVLPTLFSAEEESVWRNACWLLIHGVLLLELISGHRLTQRQLGALVPWVFIKSGKRVESANEQHIYSYRGASSVVLMVAGEDILVLQYGRPVFEGALAREYVQRLIDRSQPLSTIERLGWLLENKMASLVWQSLLALLYLLALLVPLLAG